MNNKLRQRRQSGFSLVEVLIALVVMSVGMLGIAGLYVQSLQAGRTSMFRHHAVTLAGDVADRIRANPRGVATYEDAVGADNNCITGAINCTSIQMAENDVWLWQAQADDTLPNGDVAVVFAAAAGVTPPTYQITVSWVEPGQPLSYVITISVLDI